MKPLDRRRFAAAAERILPADAGLPSASEAHVLGYLDDFRKHSNFAAIETDLLEGLGLLGDQARVLFDVEFADADAEQQDAVLRHLEAMPLPSVRRFFTSLIRLTLAGYLCDPVHGGNRGAIAWRALDVHIKRSPSPKETLHA